MGNDHQREFKKFWGHGIRRCTEMLKSMPTRDLHKVHATMHVMKISLMGFMILIIFFAPISAWSFNSIFLQAFRSPCIGNEVWCWGSLGTQMGQRWLLFLWRSCDLLVLCEWTRHRACMMHLAASAVCLLGYPETLVGIMRLWDRFYSCLVVAANWGAFLEELMKCSF